MATDRYTIRAEFEDNATRGMDVLDKAMAALDISGGKLSTGIGVLRAEIANLEEEISSGKGWDELSSRIRNTLDEIQEFGGTLDDQRAALKAIETQALRTGEPVALVANAARKLADEADSGAAASQHLALAMDLASAAMLKTEDAGAAVGRVVRGDVTSAFNELGGSAQKIGQQLSRIPNPASRARVGIELLQKRVKEGPPLYDKLQGVVGELNARLAASGFGFITVERAAGGLIAAIAGASAAVYKFTSSSLEKYIQRTPEAKNATDRLTNSVNELQVTFGKGVESQAELNDSTRLLTVALDSLEREMSGKFIPTGTAFGDVAVLIAAQWGASTTQLDGVRSAVKNLTFDLRDAITALQVLIKTASGSKWIGAFLGVSIDTSKAAAGDVGVQTALAQINRQNQVSTAAGGEISKLLSAGQAAKGSSGRGGGGGGGGGRIADLQPGFGGQGLAFGLTGELLATTAAQFITDLESRWADAQARQFSAITAARVASGAGFQAIRERGDAEELAGALARVRDQRGALTGALEERKALGMDTKDLEGEIKRLEGVESSLERATNNARQLEVALESIGAQVLPQLTSSFIDFAAAVAEGSASIKDLGKFAAGTLGDILINQSKQLAQYAILNAGVFEWIGASYATLATNPAGLVVAAGGLLAAGLLLKAFAGSAGGAGGATGRADSQAGAELERMGRTLFDRERSRTGDTYVLQVGDRDMRATVRDMTQDGLDRGQISLTRARAMG